MVRAAEKIINKTKKIAAHLMEAAEADIELKDGMFSVAGTDKSVAWGDVTLAAYVPHNYPLEDIEPGLEETAFYDPANFTFPAGAYACEVEVDPDTGQVSIEKFTAAKAGWEEPADKLRQDLHIARARVESGDTATAVKMLRSITRI